MISPNFFIIGAQKCGTTSLYQYLKQHPEIFFPIVKEPEYFTYSSRQTLNPDGCPKLNKTHITDYNDYINLFQNATNEIAIGEASPTYIYGKNSFKRIKQEFPNIKIIAILRDPVKRAFSHFEHNINRGIEPINNFELAIAAEKDRINAGWPLHWHYIENGFYHKHLINFYKEFPKKNIHIIIFEEFILNPSKTLQEICGFLGVNKYFIFETQLKYAVTGRPVFKSLNWLLLKQNPIKRSLKGVIPNAFAQYLKHIYSKHLLVKSKIDPAVKSSIMELFKTDILNLSSLLQKDLSHWKDS